MEGDGDEEVLSCVGGRSFRSVRERWWYIALSKCGVRTGLGLDTSALQNPTRIVYVFFFKFIRTEDRFFPQREPLIRESHPPFFQCLAVGVKRQNSMFGKEKQRRRNSAVRNRDTLEGCVNPSVFNFRTLRENKSYYFRYDSVPDLI